MPYVGAGETTIDNAFVLFPAPLVAFTVKLKVPDEVGVPDIVPDDDNINPPGRLPLMTSHVAAGYPVAVRVCEYAESTVPPGNDVVVIVGAAEVALTVITKSFV